MRRILVTAFGVGAAVLVAAVLLVLPSCGVRVRGNRRNILLVTYETTRADHLGIYGYSRDTSPALDALARRGAVFEEDLTVSPRTNPSLASLMTSRYPHEHGVRNLLLPLEPENRTLAEILRDAGYATGAVQTHPRLIASCGLAQGFRTYDDDVAAHPRADQAARAAISWLKRASRGRRPWFLWIHFMDPHWTYDPPPPWRTMFGKADPRPARLYEALKRGERTIGPVIFRNRMPPDEVQAFVNMYDGELRFTDAALGELLSFLRREELVESTVVAVTADHGESLGENDYFFEHGDFGTEPEIHVPLVLAAPDRRVPAGSRVGWTVSSLDVAPTLLDLVGLTSEGAFRGRSLLPLLGDSAEAADRSCFGETGKRFHEENTRREVEGIRGKWRWLERGRFKLRYEPRSAGPPLRLLFDLHSPAGEKENVSKLYRERFRRFSAELDAWLAEDTMPERHYHITPEARALLRSLGYVN